jgi:hypothetical protein
MAEWTMKNFFYQGIAFPFEFSATLYQHLGRREEARDTARLSLKQPWWTVSDLQGYASLACSAAGRLLAICIHLMYSFIRHAARALPKRAPSSWSVEQLAVSSHQGHTRPATCCCASGLTVQGASCKHAWRCSPDPTQNVAWCCCVQDPGAGSNDWVNARCIRLV